MKTTLANHWLNGLSSSVKADDIAEIVAGACDFVVVVSGDGTVLETAANNNFTHRRRLADYKGRPFHETINVESVPKFDARWAERGDMTSKARTVELNHKGANGGEEFPVRYSFHKIAADGTTLLLGHDLQPVADMQQQLVSAQIALERDFEARRDQDTRFRVLLASLDTATIFVSLPGGAIKQHNPAAQALLARGSASIEGSNIARFLEKPQGAGLLDKLMGSASEQQTIKLRGKADGQMLSIKTRLFRAGGEQVALCQLDPDGAAAQQSDLVRETLSGLFDSGIDGILFVRPNGAILSANTAFQNMVNATSIESIRDRRLADFLTRSSIDQNVMFENATRTGAMRLFSTRLISEFGGEVPVEISTVRLSASDQTVFAMILRDVSHADVMRASERVGTDVDTQSVVELIGNQSLKEIVAKTTDVVERLSIETAVALTSNNRVAAAEMLGLSRQSLYVKLRKYGLLKQDKDQS